MRKADVTDLLEYISAAYPSLQVTEARIAVWTDVLFDIDTVDIATDAVRELIRRGDAFPPSPGQVLQAIRERIEDHRRRLFARSQLAENLMEAQERLACWEAVSGDDNFSEKVRERHLRIAQSDVLRLTAEVEADAPSRKEIT